MIPVDGISAFLPITPDDPITALKCGYTSTGHVSLYPFGITEILHQKKVSEYDAISEDETHLYSVTVVSWFS